MKKKFDYDDYVHWNIDFGCINGVNITPLEICATTIGLERPDQVEIDKYILKDKSLIKLTLGNIDNLFYQIGKHLDDFETSILYEIANKLENTSYFNHAGDIYGVVEQTELYINKKVLVDWLETNLFNICLQNEQRYWLGKKDWVQYTEEIKDPKQKLYTILGDSYIDRIESVINNFHYCKFRYFMKKFVLSFNVTAIIPTAIFCGWCNSFSKTGKILDIRNWNQVNILYSIVLLMFILGSIYPFSVKYKKIRLYKNKLKLIKM